MKLTVSAVQFAPTLGDMKKNLATVEKMIGEAAKLGSKIVVLPEICDTGYDLSDIGATARSIPNETTDFFSTLAKRHKLSIVAGLAERKGADVFNAAVLFGPDGRIIDRYHKTHLCPIPPFNEPKVFAYGDRLFIAELAGTRIAPLICYDCRFPEAYRKLAVDGAQIIVQPTAFPRSRIDQLETCLRARTIENQYFIVTANFHGKPGEVELGGNSMILGPDGKILAKASQDKDEVITYTIDLGEIDMARKDRPVFTQRRPEIY
jgi:predicted amidohydrolase